LAFVAALKILAKLIICPLVGRYTPYEYSISKH